MFLGEARQRDLDFAGLDSWPGWRSDAMAPETEPAVARRKIYGVTPAGFFSEWIKPLV
jgi:hypothetical protein